jgi:hypothetical protein
LRSLVDSRASHEEIAASIERSRSAAETPDLAVPTAGILQGDRGLPRHLRFAEWTINNTDSYPDEDVSDLLGRDLDTVLSKMRSAVPEPPGFAELMAAVSSLEGPTVEFKEAIPDQTRTLARDFAALAPRGGSVFLGVDDSGTVTGLCVASLSEVDAMDRRLRGIADKSVDPSVHLETVWFTVNNGVVAEVRVLPSGDPIHYVDNIPYLRDGSVSRPARPAEVIRAIREKELGGTLVHIEPGASTYIRNEAGDTIGAFAHLRVQNVCGRMLFKVRGTAQFVGRDSVPLFEEAMPLRWSSTPEPLATVWTPDGPRPIVEPSRIPASFTVDLAPGDGEDAAVSVRFTDTGTAYGWTGESYLWGGRQEKWRLPPGPCRIEVSVRAEGRVESARFDLDLDAPPNEFSPVYTQSV